MPNSHVLRTHVDTVGFGDSRWKNLLKRSRRWCAQNFLLDYATSMESRWFGASKSVTQKAMMNDDSKLIYIILILRETSKFQSFQNWNGMGICKDLTEKIRKYVFTIQSSMALARESIDLQAKGDPLGSLFWLSSVFFCLRSDKPSTFEAVVNVLWFRHGKIRPLIPLTPYGENHLDGKGMTCPTRWCPQLWFLEKM